jgi:hypothetical protein
MADDKITALKAKYAKIPNLFPQKGLLKIEEGKPVTFFVLVGDYSTKGVWVHPVGVHYIKGNKSFVPSKKRNRRLVTFANGFAR